MIDSLKERLRVWGTDARDKPPISLLHEALARIEALEAEIKRLRERNQYCDEAFNHYENSLEEMDALNATLEAENKRLREEIL